MNKTNALAIVKLGGSILSDKQVPFSIRVEIMHRIANELSFYKGPLIIIHGGGSFGHPMASAFDYSAEHAFLNSYGIANIHYAMRIFNNAIIKVLLDNGINAISIEPLSYLYTHDGSAKKIFLDSLRKSLDHGLVPVTFGDIVIDEKRGGFIISGDDLIVILAKALDAAKIILCTDVDGVFVKEEDKLKLIQEINQNNIDYVLSQIRKLTTFRQMKIDVTGGMAHKIEELWKLAKQGIPSFIINGLIPNRLKKILLNEYDIPHTRIVFR